MNGGVRMFWIGFALGVLTTFAFLMTEHLIGQSKWQRKIAFAKSAFSKTSAISVLAARRWRQEM
jgi:uncharacterized protein with PQ loop repeat